MTTGPILFEQTLPLEKMNGRETALQFFIITTKNIYLHENMDLLKLGLNEKHSTGENITAATCFWVYVNQAHLW